MDTILQGWREGKWTGLHRGCQLETILEGGWATGRAFSGGLPTRRNAGGEGNWTGLYRGCQLETILEGRGEGWATGQAFIEAAK